MGMSLKKMNFNQIRTEKSPKQMSLKEMHYNSTFNCDRFIEVLSDIPVSSDNCIWAPSKVSPKQFFFEQIIRKDLSLSLILMPHIQRDMNKIRADQCLIYVSQI